MRSRRTVHYSTVFVFPYRPKKNSEHKSPHPVDPREMSEQIQNALSTFARKEDAHITRDPIVGQPQPKRHPRTFPLSMPEEDTKTPFSCPRSRESFFKKRQTPTETPIPNTPQTFVKGLTGDTGRAPSSVLSFAGCRGASSCIPSIPPGALTIIILPLLS